MMSSEQCRGYAAEYRELAQSGVSPAKKKILLELARHWEMAADQVRELERRKTADQQIQALKASAGAD